MPYGEQEGSLVVVAPGSLVGVDGVTVGGHCVIWMLGKEKKVCGKKIADGGVKQSIRLRQSVLFTVREKRCVLEVLGFAACSMGNTNLE